MAKGIEVALAYIHGRLEAQLETFAVSLGIPKAELARRMAALLSGSENGSLLGSEDRMLVRGQAPEGSETTRKVAVASRPPKNGAPSSLMKQYWARMTPEERAAEVRRRVLKRKKAKEKG